MVAVLQVAQLRFGLLGSQLLEILSGSGAFLLALLRGLLLASPLLCMLVGFALQHTARGRPGAALLDDMREFMREQTIAARVMWLELLASEHDMAAHGECVGRYGRCCRGGGLVAVHAHISEVLSQPAFESRAHSVIQRPPGRPQYTVHLEGALDTSRPVGSAHARCTASASRSADEVARSGKGGRLGCAQGLDHLSTIGHGVLRQVSCASLFPMLGAGTAK